MKYQPDHRLITSFRLWFDDHLLRNGEAFSVQSGNFAPSDDLQMQDSSGVIYNSWITPNRQWGYDSTIPGVIVPNGVYIDGVYHSGDIKIDADNGRVLIPENLTPTTVSGTYTAKDFEVRVTSQSEESVLFGDDPGIRFGDTSSGIVPDSVGFPFVYLKHQPGKSEGFGFGGFMKTTMTVRAIVVANDSYLFDGINILFRDAAEKYFAVLDPINFPFNEFGALKSAGFNYRQIAHTASQTNPDDLYYIKSVALSPFSEDVNSKIAKDALGGFIDFRIESLGFPHQRFV